MNAPANVRVFKLPSNSHCNSSGGPGCERLLISPSANNAISLDNGEMVNLPLGVRMVVVKPRRETNDWYAEIDGPRHVAAIGALPEDAFLAAVEKLAA